MTRGSAVVRNAEQTNSETETQMVVCKARGEGTGSCCLVGSCLGEWGSSGGHTTLLHVMPPKCNLKLLKVVNLYSGYFKTGPIILHREMCVQPSILPKKHKSWKNFVLPPPAQLVQRGSPWVGTSPQIAYKRYYPEHTTPFSVSHRSRLAHNNLKFNQWPYVNSLGLHPRNKQI